VFRSMASEVLRKGTFGGGETGEVWVRGSELSASVDVGEGVSADEGDVSRGGCF